MKVEVNKFLQCPFHNIAIVNLVEVTEAIGVIHGLHLSFGIAALLGSAQYTVADIRSQQFHSPGRRHERFRRWSFDRQRITQVVKRKRVADQHRHGVGFLPCRAACTPYFQRPVATLVFAVQNLVQGDLMKEFKLWLVTKETSLVDRQMIDEGRDLGASTRAGEKLVVVIEAFQTVFPNAAPDTILQEVRAALIEE